MQTVYLVVCVKGLHSVSCVLGNLCEGFVSAQCKLCTRCTVKAVYLLVVCVKDLCLHSASCVLGSLCEGFVSAQCKQYTW